MDRIAMNEMATMNMSELFSRTDRLSFSRETSVVMDGDGGLWAGFTVESGRKAHPVIVRFAERERSEFVVQTSGQCHRINLFADGETVAAVWNEYDETAGVWRIMMIDSVAKASAPDAMREVRVSKRLCADPCGIVVDGVPTIAWSEELDDVFRVMLSRRKNGRWSEPTPISPPRIDAFRPTLAKHEGRLFAAYDFYQRKHYSIDVVEVDGETVKRHRELRGKRAHWLTPSLRSGNGRLFISWIASRMVMDSNDIVDHLATGMVGEVKDDGVVPLGDEREDFAVAELRLGLLAPDDGTHRNYEGLRRNLNVATTDSSDIWCFWERLNPLKGGGELIGKTFVDATQRWSDEMVVHEGGANYSTVHRHGGVACFSFHDEEAKALIPLQSGAVSLTNARPNKFVHDAAPRWTRWRPARIRRHKIGGEVDTFDGPLLLYWSDTHCHSDLSPDVEGKPDELIHFARDVAKLDAVCLPDNDFYPRKALSPADWRIQQELANHHTVPGEFVVFPGYEYTFWDDRSGERKINHRIVLFPKNNGPLLRHIDSESETLESFHAELRRLGARPLCYPHHVAYEIVNPDLERLVEICSSWRVCMAESDFTMRRLMAGARFGFMGSSDGHRAVPGLGGAMTGVYAKSLEPEALFDAYMTRRTIVTQGFFCRIDFRIDDLFIGDEGTCSTRPTIRGFAETPRKIKEIDVIRDGEVVKRLNPNARQAKFEFREDALPRGDHFHVLRLRLEGTPGHNMDPSLNSEKNFINTGKFPQNLAKARGCLAWTSPIWTRV